MNASGVEMSGSGAPSRMTTPVTVRPRSGLLSGTNRPSLVERGDRGLRQDDEVGLLAALDAVAQRAGGAEIQIELVAGVAFEFGAERRHHRLHGAGTHDFDVGHGHFLLIAGGS